MGLIDGKRSLVVVAILVSAGLPAGLGQPGTGTPVDERRCEQTREGCEAWVAVYDGPPDRLNPTRSWDRVFDLAVSPNGSTLAATGKSMRAGEGFSIATVAYHAPTGSQEWVARYDRPPHGHAAGDAVAFSSDGETVYVAGETDGGSSSWDVNTIAYDASTGEQRWMDTLTGTRDDSLDSAVDLVVSPDGSTVFSVATTRDEGSGLDYTTIAYNASTGERRWIAQLEGPTGFDVPSQAAVSPDGKTLYVTGKSRSEKTGQDIVTQAYDAGTGVERWRSSYAGPGDAVDGAGSIALSPDGERLYVTGSSDYEPLTLALDAKNGSTLWTQEEGGAIVPSPEGDRLFLAGGSQTLALATEDGSQLWNRSYDAPSGRQTSAARVALSLDASTVYVVHEATRTTSGCIGILVGACGSTSLITVARDAKTGGLAWDAIYDSGDDRVAGLVVNPTRGLLHVADFNGDDYNTLTYDAASMPPADASLLRQRPAASVS